MHGAYINVIYELLRVMINFVAFNDEIIGYLFFKVSIGMKRYEM